MEESEIASEKEVEKFEPELEPEGVGAARPDTAISREKEEKTSIRTEMWKKEGSEWLLYITSSLLEHKYTCT